MTTRSRRLLIMAGAGAALMTAALAWWWLAISARLHRFDGQRAYQDVLAQMSFGPRTPGSAAHSQAIGYIEASLEKAGWKPRLQATTWNGFEVQNIVASRSEGAPAIILGAHYDSRLLADRDQGPGWSGAVPGANDGASGVAVLLELARSLPADSVPVWLVFFDAEDSGGLDGRDWIMGSRAFAASLTFTPRAVIIVDMVGDADLNLYYERNSDSQLRADIWRQAAELGFQAQFIPEERHSLIDDHTPFLQAGLPAVDIIDFDYPYWHTAADTADKVSAQSLEAVGRTLEAWIAAQR